MNGIEAIAAKDITVVPNAPRIFVYGRIWGVIQNQDHSLNEPANPAKAGSYVTLYGTGVGLVSPAVQTGDAAPGSPLSYATTDLTGLTTGNVGLLQVNVRIPAFPSGTYPIQITAGGVSSNAPFVAVKE